MSETSETRELLVFGPKTFKITVPAESKLTFAPFSPPSKVDGYARNPGNAAGTLRVYAENNEKRIIAVFSGVTGFRDTELGYIEQVVVEEGATIWKNDENGYMRDEKVSGTRTWVTPEAPALPPATIDDDEGNF